MAESIIEFFERRFRVRLLPSQKRILEEMDSSRPLVLVRPRFMGEFALQKILAGHQGVGDG